MRFPICVGKDPDIKKIFDLMISIYILSLCGIYIHQKNILPEKEFWLTYKLVSLFRFPICVGRDPDRH